VRKERPARRYAIPRQNRFFPDFWWTVREVYSGAVIQYAVVMSETAISVAEAARDFLGLLDRVESRRESAILVREGKPVATLSPLPTAAITCAELAARWPSLPKLSSEEATAFADDIELARAKLPPLKPAWG
jgi:antitoxin (DNA-binding transcriptional repressor) of toxin-antitoxin stability system